MGAVLAALESQHPLPQCIILDLDYTIWPFYCEFVDIKKTTGGEDGDDLDLVRDAPRLYPDTMAIIEGIKAAGIKMAVASRTPTPDKVRADSSKGSCNRDVKMDGSDLPIVM